MLYKKRWSDGLNQDFDCWNEFEAKLYCFAGDGGPSGGGSKTPDTKAQQDTKASSQEPDRGFRGEQSAALAAARSNLSSGIANKQAIADDLRGKVSRAVIDSGFYDKPTNQTAPGLLDMYPDARVPDVVTPAVEDPTKASFAPDVLNNTSLQSIYDLVPQIDLPAQPETYTPQYQDIQQQNPLQDIFSVGPGTITPSYDAATGNIGVDFNMPFNTSSVNQQGIGSLDQARVMDALTSGVRNPQTAMPAGTVQTADAGSGGFNVFGTLTAPLEFLGGNLVRKGNTYTSQGSGGITSTRRQKNTLDKIASTGKNLADQVGLGSLFGN